MARTYFTSETYLRDNLPISRNIDSKDIVPHIQMAEELYIQDILGANFYTYLIGVFSGQTLNANETILVQDYIKPAEAYRTLALALPFLNMQVVNKGPQTQNEDYSASIDLTNLKFLLNETSNRAEFYEKRLNSYLCLNNALFPEYITNNTDIISPNKQAGWNDSLLFY